jgi:hypothetical protein
MLCWFTTPAVTVVMGQAGVVLTWRDAGVASGRLCACSEGEDGRTRFDGLEQASVCNPRHQRKHPREQRDTSGVSKLPASEVRGLHQNGGLARQKSRAGSAAQWLGFIDSPEMSMAPTSSARSVNPRAVSGKALVTCVLA